MMDLNFLYTNSILLLVFSLIHYTRNNLRNKQRGALHIALSSFPIFHKGTSMEKNVDQLLL